MVSPSSAAPLARSHQALPKNPARLARRKLMSSLFAGICGSTTLIAFLVLMWLLAGIFQQGWKTVTLTFLRSPPSVLSPKTAGIFPGIMGSIWVLGTMMLFAIPVGVGAAIFLQEYAERNKFARFVQVNIANLAGVPAVVYGILGLAVFVRWLHLGTSVIAGALTLGLLILPVIIIASQEALRSVPSSLRDGSYALGATKWQTIRRQVLPVAMPGILTGIILAVSRAIGEAAPLLILGGLGYIAFAPRGPRDDFTVLPIQIYNYASSPKEAFQTLAASGIIVLLGVLLTMNALAIWLRFKFNKKF